MVVCCRILNLKGMRFLNCLHCHGYMLSASKPQRRMRFLNWWGVLWSQWKILAKTEAYSSERPAMYKSVHLDQYTINAPRTHHQGFEPTGRVTMVPFKISILLKFELDKLHYRVTGINSYWRMLESRIWGCVTDWMSKTKPNLPKNSVTMPSQVRS